MTGMATESHRTTMIQLLFWRLHYLPDSSAPEKELSAVTRTEGDKCTARGQKLFNVLTVAAAFRCAET